MGKKRNRNKYKNFNIKRNNNMKNTSRCNIFEDATIPPCAKFLGSYSPLIKNGKIIYPSYNRLFFFLTYNSLSSQESNYKPDDMKTYTFQENGNIQITLYDFLIGAFIDEVQKKLVEYDEDIKIHDNEYADKFIKVLLNKNYNIFTQFIPSLTFTISNSNAILSLYTAEIQISPINFYIIFMLNRFQNNKALLFGNNSYVTPDFINYQLANLFLEY